MKTLLLATVFAVTAVSGAMVASNSDDSQLYINHAQITAPGSEVNQIYPSRIADGSDNGELYINVADGSDNGELYVTFA